ncbi:hypothetical protein RLW55_17875 [Hyphomicrobium sp. B1]|uniref:hypothetical protein n=1 Tax=Hyphomicrobium sp. B1 TaxID=3075651 RepID=UPI003C2F1367
MAGIVVTIWDAWRANTAEHDLSLPTKIGMSFSPIKQDGFDRANGAERNQCSGGRALNLENDRAAVAKRGPQMGWIIKRCVRDGTVKARGKQLAGRRQKSWCVTT